MIWVIDGDRVRQRRTELGWSQHELAKKSALSRRRVVEIEKGYKIVQHETILFLQDALELTEDELVAAKVPSWRDLPEHESANVDRNALARALRLDMKGEHADAVREARTVYDKLAWDEEPDASAAVAVLFVTLLDRANQIREALKVAGEVLDRSSDDHTRTWAKYHVGICKRRLGDLDDARAIFEQMLDHSDGRFFASASHQLGVIELEDARQATGHERDVALERAEVLLRQSAERWREFKLSADALHRLGYTLRRLGQVAHERGHRQESLKHLLDALEIFSRSHAQRYVDTTRAEIIEWFGEGRSPVDP